MINWKNVFMFFGTLLLSVVLMAGAIAGGYFALETLPAVQTAFDVFIKSFCIIVNVFVFLFGFLLVFYAFEG